MLKGETTLPWWAYIISLLLGGMSSSFEPIRLLIVFSAVVTPFSTLLYARMGNGIATNQLMKMVAGAVNPGKPVANLYVCTFSFPRFLRSADSSTVLDVESRRRFDVDRTCRRSQDGPVPQDPSPCHVPHTTVGHHTGGDRQLRCV